MTFSFQIAVSIENLTFSFQIAVSIENLTFSFQIAVSNFENNVIMHPVMQQLIRTKWNLFGKVGAAIEFTIHLIFCIVWTVLGIFLNRNGDYYGTGAYWRIPIESFGVCITFFFILKVRVFIIHISFSRYVSAYNVYVYVPYAVCRAVA